MILTTTCCYCKSYPRTLPCITRTSTSILGGCFRQQFDFGFKRDIGRASRSLGSSHAYIKDALRYKYSPLSRRCLRWFLNAALARGGRSVSALRSVPNQLLLAGRPAGAHCAPARISAHTSGARSATHIFCRVRGKMCGGFEMPPLAAGAR